MEQQLNIGREIRISFSFFRNTWCLEERNGYDQERNPKSISIRMNMAIWGQSCLAVNCVLLFPSTVPVKLAKAVLGISHLSSSLFPRCRSYPLIIASFLVPVCVPQKRFSSPSPPLIFFSVKHTKHSWILALLLLRLTNIIMTMNIMLLKSAVCSHVVVCVCVFLLISCPISWLVSFSSQDLQEFSVREMLFFCVHYSNAVQVMFIRRKKNSVVSSDDSRQKRRFWSEIKFLQTSKNEKKRWFSRQAKQTKWSFKYSCGRKSKQKKRPTKHETHSWVIMGHHSHHICLWMMGRRGKKSIPDWLNQSKDEKRDGRPPEECLIVTCSQNYR